MLLWKAFIGLLPFLETSSSLSLVSLEEEAVGLVQLTFNTSLAFNTSSEEGAGLMPTPDKKVKKNKEGKKKKKARLPAYQAWLKDMGIKKLKVEGDPNRPLYLFLVRRFLDSVDKKKKHTKWKEESVFRYNIGSIIFCDKVTSGHCFNKDAGFMRTNAVPMLKEYGQALATRKFNGDVLITAHSGISPRHVATGMEGDGNGVYKSAKFIATTYLRPLMENPNTVVQRIVSLGCNSGTRFNYKIARKEIKKLGKLTKATRQKLKTGVSFVDKLLKYVAEFAAEGLNAGIVPDIYGANGYTFNGYGMGRTEQRIHTIYDEGSKTECMIQAVWKNQGAGKDQKGGCLNLDYTLMRANPMHWSYMGPNIEKFGYPNGDPLDMIPPYPEDAEVAGFLKARLYDETTEGPTDGPQNGDGEGGPRADDLERVSNLQDVSDESGAEDDGCEPNEDGCDGTNDDSDDDDNDDEPDDEPTDDEDDDDDDEGDDDEDDDDASMLQVGSASEPAQFGRGVDSLNTSSSPSSSRTEEIHKQVRATLNVTDLDAKLQGGLEALSEQQKVSVFNLMTRVMHDSNLTFLQKRSKLLQEIAEGILPEVLSKGMGKQWFLDMIMGDESKGKEPACIQQKLHIPLAMFEVVMAVFSAMKCDAALMCAADWTEIAAAIGHTSAHLRYADAKCSVSPKPDVSCTGSLEQIMGSLVGLASTSLALANQCDATKRDELVGTCSAHATFAGGWGALATLIIVKMGVQPSHMQDHAIDMIYASSMFSKMVMESVTLCDTKKNAACGAEVSKFLAFIGSMKAGEKTFREDCPELDEMCEDPELNPDQQDNDEDGLIDNLDPNDDNDEYPDEMDSDQDGDEIPDVKDPDDDNDGRMDAVDQPGMQWWRELICNTGVVKGQSPLESLMSPPNADKTIRGMIPDASTADVSKQAGRFIEKLLNTPKKILQSMTKGEGAPPSPVQAAEEVTSGLVGGTS